MFPVPRPQSFKNPGPNLFSWLWRKKIKNNQFFRKKCLKTLFFFLWRVFWLSEKKHVLKKNMPIYLIFFAHVVGIINLSVCSHELRFSSLNWLVIQCFSFTEYWVKTNWNLISMLEESKCWAMKSLTWFGVNDMQQHWSFMITELVSNNIIIIYKVVKQKMDKEEKNWSKESFISKS